MHSSGQQVIRLENDIHGKAIIVFFFFVRTTTGVCGCVCVYASVAGFIIVVSTVLEVMGWNPLRARWEH